MTHASLTELPLSVAEDELRAALEGIPNRPAVFLLAPRTGKPLLARTNVLRRRLHRLLGLETPGETSAGQDGKPPGPKRSRTLDLRGTAEKLQYWFTGSALEGQFVLLEKARQHLGPDFRKQIRLRMPPYVKLMMTNEFPRTQVATHLGRWKGVGPRAIYFGPFRSRSTAARFESEFLDLFQIRRCQEDLRPSTDHPGCIYGEMGRCLRPCQRRVTESEYRSEVLRVADFLRTSGQSLLEAIAATRDRFSEDLDFEGATLMHQRYLRVSEVLAIPDEMARDVDNLHAVVVVRAAAPDTVLLGWLRSGHWQGFFPLGIASADGGTAISLDTRVRETAASVPTSVSGNRAEELAVISRWFYSSWCDGEMILFDQWEKLPVRKIVNAVSRVAQQKPRPRTRCS